MLKTITIYLPTGTFSPNSDFIDLFSNCDITETSITFTVNQAGHTPNTVIKFTSNLTIPKVAFVCDLPGSVQEIFTLNLENSTGKEWASSYTYSPVNLSDFRQRMHKTGIVFQAYDHLGVNIPSLGAEHSSLTQLYGQLSPLCLLHDFPGNSDYKFIIPGSSEEIAGKVEINYQEDRKPKFELVNFTTCSTPILQIDLATNARFEDIKALFPEAIIDEDLRNAWVYLRNSSGIDICIVLNEIGKGWTKFFAGARVKS